MTVANLFAQHRAGKVSKEKFLYEVRRDAQLPFISNLTSYEDAIKMLKQKSVIKEAGKYDISDRDIPGLDKTQIKTLETWINLINADLNWWNTQYPNYSGNASIIMGDISKAFNLSIDDFVKKYENDNPISVANLAKKQISKKQEGLNESKKIIKEAKFGVYIPKGVEKGTKINIVVEPGIRYPNSEFISDIDGKYTFNTNTNMGQITIPHSDLIVYSKPKDSINEQTDLHLQIDRLNPILVKKAVNSELAKLPMIDAQVYQKMTEKVVKKLQKDPRAYDDVLVTNAKEIHKVDEKLKMTQVKGELNDPHNQMKSPKGLEKPKTNVKASKTENKKGKPKGVKEMKGSKKGHGGIKQMENPGTKETVLESLLSFMFKKKLNEDTHHEYTQGKKVKTPKGEGVIEGLIGDTATVAYENGVKEDIQINALRHYEEEANKPVEEKTPEVKKHEPTMDEKKDKVIQKVLEFLKKKKMTELKKGAVNIRTSNPMNPDSPSIQMAQNLSARGVDTVFVSDKNK